jgi:MoaA/NifB/PqqE/SkfB family radical SAM enzyme
LKRVREENIRYSGVAARLLFNAARFSYCRVTGTPLKPTVLSLAVTSRCNSHCIMCNIWKSTKDIPDIQERELSGQEILNLLSNSIFTDLVELDITGGEPHLRDDLADIILGIVRLKSNSLPKLRSIIITSNGFLSERIISNYRRILASSGGARIDLVSVTSLDGIGETHDRVRGTSGAFKLVSGTIRGLLELKKEYPFFIPGIKTTILPQNVDALGDILEFASSSNMFHIISPALFTAARFRNMDMRDGLALRPSDLDKVLDFYRRQEFDTGYFYMTARHFLASGCKPWTCSAMYNYAFIDSDGNVYPCEIIPEVIGNVKEQNFPDIWYGKAARRWRRKIGKTECCRTCHEPGAIRYSAFTGGMSYLNFLSKLGRRQYLESLQGEGYIKYFG